MLEDCLREKHQVCIKVIYFKGILEGAIASSTAGYEIQDDSDRFFFTEQVMIFSRKQGYLDDQFYFRFILACFHVFFFSKILVTYQIGS